MFNSHLLRPLDERLGMKSAGHPPPIKERTRVEVSFLSQHHLILVLKQPFEIRCLGRPKHLHRARDSALIYRLFFPGISSSRLWGQAQQEAISKQGSYPIMWAMKSFWDMSLLLGEKGNAAASTLKNVEFELRKWLFEIILYFSHFPCLLIKKGKYFCLAHIQIHYHKYLLGKPCFYS